MTPVINPLGILADMAPQGMAFAQQPQPAQSPQPTQAPDPSTLFNTMIPAERQKEYQDWVTQLPKNLRNTDDYDLRGAFIGGAQPQGEHLTDQFKKPNHMTFSTDSQYSGRDGQVGGRWVKTNDNWTFYASPTNLKYHPAKELQDYFRRVEPGNTLVLPPEASKPVKP